MSYLELYILISVFFNSWVACLSMGSLTLYRTIPMAPVKKKVTWYLSKMSCEKAVGVGSLLCGKDKN